MARTKDRSDDPLHGGALQVPRSRGAVSGVTLIVLGAFGLLVPLIGPWFSFGFTPDKSWHWTAARFWLEILPGAVTLVGGLLLLLAANRISASLGAWLAVAAGAWFVVGTSLAPPLGIGSPGTPLHNGKWLRAIEFLALLDGLGALIVFVAAAAFGRLSVRSVRDVKAAQRREAEAAAAAEEQRRAQAALEEQQRRDSAYEDQLRREGAEKERQRLAGQQEQDERAAKERDDYEARIRQDQQRQDALAVQRQRERDAQLAEQQRAAQSEQQRAQPGQQTSTVVYPPAGYDDQQNGR